MESSILAAQSCTLCDMRLPQSCIRSLSVFSVQSPFVLRLVLPMIGMILLFALGSPNAFATVQLTRSPSILRFGNVDVGQTETLAVTLTNTGLTSVTVSGVSASETAFATPDLSLPLVLTAGQSVDVSVSYTPKTTGWTSGSITFSSSASNSTLTVQVGGSGVDSVSVTASPSNLSFGQVSVGSSDSLPIVLTNARTWSVTISGVQTTGNVFSISGATFPLTLAGGQSVALTASYTPTSTGVSGGSLLFTGPGLCIPLTGDGTVGIYSVNLMWNSTPDVAGYNVYRSTSSSGTYSKINSAVDANTAYTDSTVLAGNTYYYSATSVNAAGQESTLSKPPVEAVIP